MLVVGLEFIERGYDWTGSIIVVCGFLIAWLATILTVNIVFYSGWKWTKNWKK